MISGMKIWKKYNPYNLWNLLNPYYKGLLLVLFIWGNYFVYLWPNIFFWGDEGIYAGWIGVWGDWAAHNAYASRFAFREISDWVTIHPLYIFTKFTYPFLSNLISGLLIRYGVDRVAAFIVPTILTTLLFLYAIYNFYYAQLKSYGKSFWAVFVFLTSGGLGFLWFFRDLHNSSNILETLAFPPDQYTQLQEGTVYWLNTITGQLIPQRAFLLGLTIGLFVINYLYKFLKKENYTNRDYLYVVLLGFITSLIVLAHMHSFMVVFVFCIFAFILNWRKWKLFSVYAISTGIPAIYFYSLLYGGAIGTSFFSWHPGWLANENSKDMNFIYFWIINWGIFLPIVIVWGILKDYFKNEFFLTGLGVFVICNLFLLQPFDWDNSKLLSWVYLFWTIPVVDFLSYVWKKKFGGARIVTIIFLIIICLSGLLDVYRITKTQKLKYLMYSNEDINLANEFIEISDPDDIVLTSDKHNHWVSNLTGRQVLLGYRGWMWTYGINDYEVYNNILEMYAGGDNAFDLFEKYNIKYAVIGLSEKYDYKANQVFFDDNFQLVLSNTEYNVYKIDN